MRRSEIIHAIQKVVSALQESDIMTISSQILHGERLSQDVYPKVLASYRSYFDAFNSFSRIEKEILRIFNLDLLNQDEFWSRIFRFIGGERENPEEFFKLNQNLHYAVRYLPKMVELLTPEAPERFRPSTDERLGERDRRMIFTIILSEGETSISSPDRIIKAFESITDLYEACCRLENLPLNNLGVVACDSGSDKSFDFIGFAKAFEAVRDVVLSLGDRIIFFREKKFSARLELISNSLPILEQITSMEQNGKLSREECEIFRRNIISGVQKFIEAGALIPDIQGTTSFNARALIPPSPTLMLAGLAQEAKNEDKDEEQSNTLQEDLLSDINYEELQELRSAIRKMRNSKAKKSGQ